VISDTGLITPFSFTNGTPFVNNGFSITPSPTTISILNVGSASFLGGEKVFVNNSTGVLGLQLPSHSDLLDIGSVPPFGVYDLKSSLGAVFAATPSFANFPGVATSSGSLSLSSIADVTFVAFVSVPEPSSPALCGIAGTLGLGHARARRKTDS